MVKSFYEKAANRKISDALSAVALKHGGASFKTLKLHLKLLKSKSVLFPSSSIKTKI